MTEANRADVANFLDMVFGYVEHGVKFDGDTCAYCIAMRGIGEKGTDGEGVFMEPQIMPPLVDTLVIDRIFGHVQRWSAHGRASFIVPAAVAPAALSDGHATEDRILLMTCMVVDIDNGDTERKLAHAVRYIGQPTMVVHSGGTTETGHPKLHAYWRFTEPSGDVDRIAVARKLLALKLGGDAAFGRSTQVIRIPGSVYNKNGVARPCWIAQASSAEYEVSDIIAAITDMPVMEGLSFVAAGAAMFATTPLIYATGHGLNFSAFKAAKGDLMDDKPDIGQTLTTDIKEGGDVDANRWGNFNRVAGHYIKEAREGTITLDDARGMAHAWMTLHMKPAWPEARFESEFSKLAQVDERHHGPRAPNVVNFEEATGVNNPNVVPPAKMVERQDGSVAAPNKIADWDYGKWATETPPKRRFLVQGLVQAGASCLVAAEGGAGKTFLLLDLATKIALHQAGALQSWCGLPLSDEAAGSVVMFTTEDDIYELQIRLAELLTIEQRQRLKDRGTFKVVPTVNAGGAFPLVERKRAQGPARTGEVWQSYLDELEVMSNLKLVVIDTMNTTLHGEENSATVINEYVQAATAGVCGKMGATLMVTHHVRKPGANTKIWTPDDMKASIRGSTAIIGAFRCVLGIWAAPDYKARMSAMAMEPKRGQLYNLAVLKANNPEMDFNTRALMREKSGLLVDITDKEKSLIHSAQGEAAAWMIKAVEYAATVNHPFTVRSMSKRPPNGRRHQLPPILSELPERDVDLIAKRLIEEGRIVQCNPAGQTRYNYLDIPGGPLARADAAENGTLYKVAAGKDFAVPDWTDLYAYHKAEARIVERGTETDRTIRQKKKAPASDRPKGSFNPNKNPPSPHENQGSGATAATLATLPPESGNSADAP